MKRILQILESPEVRSELLEMATMTMELVETFAAPRENEHKESTEMVPSADIGALVENGQAFCDHYIHYGKRKLNGGHNHQCNKGADRTPAQRAGDAKRRKQ
ncbi:hypothetical protein N5C60_23940 [Pseudomonas mosselii]|uniref:hypothetical protein n=1 Tax=Pseudomonas mosselii TaxID=78327 RepID=UPI002430CDE9|nr:hypothetical protein [Pseudomonas mosselii]MDH1147649.1 hypothetical protein [Pseudomonas mosselii]